MAKFWKPTGLLHAGVARLACYSTAIDTVIGLVDVEVLRAEASHGIAALAEGADPRDSQAASLITYLSLQDPHLLASDLDLLWDLGVTATPITSPGHGAPPPTQRCMSGW